MKSKLKFLKLSIFVVIAAFNIQSGCVKGGKCELADDVRGAGLSFIFIDNASDRYLYTTLTPLYNIDSLQIFDENNISYRIFKAPSNLPNSPATYWHISITGIYNPQTDAAAFNSEVCKKFILKYSYNETDTMRVCYKAKETKCGSQFEYMKVFYKGSLIGSVTNETGINLTFRKK